MLIKFGSLMLKFGSDLVGVFGHRDNNISVGAIPIESKESEIAVACLVLGKFILVFNGKCEGGKAGVVTPNARCASVTVGSKMGFERVVRRQEY